MLPCIHILSPFTWEERVQADFWGADGISRERKVRPCSEKVSLSPETKRRQKKKGVKVGRRMKMRG